MNVLLSYNYNKENKKKDGLIKTKRKGFTLIELLVIIGIIGTIVLIAGWEYKRALRSQILTNEALKIVNLIQTERYKAIEQGVRRGIEFVPPDTLRTFVVQPDLTLNYEVRESLGYDFTFGKDGANAPLPIVNIAPDPSGIMFNGGRCIFNPTGMALGSGAITFTGKFGTIGIIVTPTGQVKAYKWLSGQWGEVR